MMRQKKNDEEYKEFVDKFIHLLREAMLNAPGVEVNVPISMPGLTTEITVRILPKVEELFNESKGTALRN